MIQLLKRLFSFLFFRKKNSEPFVVPVPVTPKVHTPIPPKQDKPIAKIDPNPIVKPSRGKYRMKKNILHIVHIDRIDKYRCTSLARAQELAGHLRSIQRATFKDKTGKEFQIV